MFSKRMKSLVPVTLIILLSALFRFIALDKIPTGITGDELIYTITAKSVFLTGKDVTGSWNPLSVFFFRYPPYQQQAELPYFLHLPVSGPLPFSLFAARIPFAVLSVGIVILLYLIAKKLFGNSAGIITGLIAAVNPWLVVMGRTAYESTPATFFYLLSLYMIISLTGWKILTGFILLMLAFYSYIGTKLIFVPFTLLSALLAFQVQKRRFAKKYLILASLSIFFTVGFLILLKTSHTGSRVGEIFLPSSPIVANQVNIMRKASIQNPILPAITNKYSAYIQIITEKFIRIFSSSYLFIEGDQFFLPLKQSFFYYIDMLFMFAGVLFLFIKYRKYFAPLLAFVVIGTFPHIFHKTTGDFSGHLALMFPFLVILIGFGVSESISQISGRLRLPVGVFLLLLYIAGVTGFSANYFLQYPLLGSADFPMRVLSKYLTLAQKDKLPVTVYSSRSGDFFQKYLFYTNSMTKRTMSSIKNIMGEPSFSFNNVFFASCGVPVKQADPSTITIYDSLCDIKLTGGHESISRLSDGGEIYMIVNDGVCKALPLNAYPTGLKIQDFNVEQLSKSRFCTTFISQ